MTRAEKFERLAALERRNEEERKELAELRKEFEAERNDTAWPQASDKYYVIDFDASIDQNPCIWGYQDDGGDEDRGALSIGNVFKTIEDAKFARERLKILAEMRRYTFRPNWNDQDQEKWYICTDGTTISYDYFTTYNFGVPAFQSRATAEKCIEAIGKDRLLKYWFGVNTKG